MTRKSLLIVSGLATFTFGFAQSGNAPSPAPKPAANAVYPLRSVKHNAFQPGEKLTYVIHYGLVNAGEATIELTESDQTIAGRKVLHAVGKGRSLGAFNMFFKVKDQYETYLDREGVFPWVFVRRVKEGGYEFSQDYSYFQNKHQVTTQKNVTHDVPANAQDMLSAFYYARTIDYSNAKEGDMFTIDCFMDDQNWPLTMKYMGRDTVELRNGKYSCLKFQPVVQEGRIFKSNNDLNVWVTDDANHIPILAQAAVLVGSIKMELSGYEGLANTISKID